LRRERPFCSEYLPGSENIFPRQIPGGNTYYFRVKAGRGNLWSNWSVSDAAYNDACGNAFLSALTINPGTLEPAFAPETVAYTVYMENSVNSIDVTATAADAGAVLTVNGQPMESGAVKTVNLDGETTAVTIVVTAQDGVTTRAYTIAFNRTEMPPPGPGEVSNFTVTPQLGAGCFKLSFITPADQNMQGVAVYEAVYGSTVWRQVYFDQNKPVLACQPGQAVDSVVTSTYSTLGGTNLQFKVAIVDQAGNQSNGVVADNGGKGYPALVYWKLKAGLEGWTTFSVPVRLAGG